MPVLLEVKKNNLEILKWYVAMNIEYIAMQRANTTFAFVNRLLRPRVLGRLDWQSCRFLNGWSDGIAKEPHVCVDVITLLPRFPISEWFYLRFENNFLGAAWDRNCLNCFKYRRCDHNYRQQVRIVTVTRRRSSSFKGFSAWVAMRNVNPVLSGVSRWMDHQNKTGNNMNVLPYCIFCSFSFQNPMLELI